MKTIDPLLVTVVVETVIIIILLLLIFFRKIGRPLTESELQERRQKKALREAKLLQEKQQEALAAQEFKRKLEEQENAIKALIAPVKLVSVSGGEFDGYDLCVVDKSGNHHVFSGTTMLMEKGMIPRFRGLFSATNALNGWEQGSVLIPG